MAPNRENHRTPEFRAKMRQVAIDRYVKEGPRLGERAYAWKGSGATYAGNHSRVARMRGKPSLCEFCGTTSAKKFDWANMSGRYDDPRDYKRLCRRCHILHDGIIPKMIKAREAMRWWLACVVCGAAFLAKKENGKYCSSACRLMRRNALQRARRTVVIEEV